MVGRRLSRYEIVEEISRGGMGIVYRAVDVTLGRDVAIKVLPDDLGRDPERRARLLHEARAASALEHPGIAVIHEVGDAEGVAFVAMELIRGEKLSDVIGSGELSPQRALSLAVEIGEALVRAHEKGVIHRDLKPSNVMVTDDGHAKIIDFGLAKVLEPVAGPRGSTASAAPLTREGVILGTAAYMAPEQARSSRVDHRSDIFAFGVTLYEMLCGRSPFERRTALETLQAILSEPLPPLSPSRDTGADVTLDLQRIVAKCTQKDPDDRYQGVRDLVVDLKAARRRLDASEHLRAPAAGGAVATGLEEAGPHPPGEVAAIAVLPFADMSPARDQDYLCEGLAEELISALTQIDGLRVASRTASFQFRGTAADVRAIGRTLGVGYLLEGSVRRAADRLRVTVQLIEVATGYQRWSQRFDRLLDDVFAMQDEIAESVARSLRGGVLSGREKRAIGRPHTAPAAYEYYLRGRQFLPRMTQDGLETSGNLFQRAIELDDGYAPAWAGLATVHATLYEWFGARDDDLARADAASGRALHLAPDLAEAHVARGFTLSLRRAYDEASARFEDAIRLNPYLFDAYYYYARACFARGEIERSAELFGKAADARQEDFQSAMLCGQSLRMLGRIDEARSAEEEGIRRAERMLALNPRDGRALSLGSGTLLNNGQVERAIDWSERSLQLYPDDASVLVNAACLRAKLRQKDQALDLLERVFARGWGKRDWVEHDPDYDILRDDARFQALLNKLK